MTQPRSTLIHPSITPYYHCVSRCVRRAFLCGDAYEHRREWVETKLLDLADIFCIDIAAYAVMSNHYHVVLHINEEKGANLTSQEVIERWHKLFKGNMVSQKFVRGHSLSKVEKSLLDKSVDEWRSRLMSISWYMRLINESVARKANLEDKCTGRFWEGRFKSQALLDEKALAACLAYVDLNPIRASIAKTPETSDHTSIKVRAKKAQKSKKPNHKNQQPTCLMPFIGNPRTNIPQGLPFRLTDYLELVELTGRIIRSDKRGFINNKLPSILDRLSIQPDNWIVLTKEFEENFNRWVGDKSAIAKTSGMIDIKQARNKPESHQLLA